MLRNCRCACHFWWLPAAFHGSKHLKLRLQYNSIRLRLTRTEVDCVQRDGRVAAAVFFPDGARLEYSLEASAAIAEAEARFADGRLVVSVPAQALRQWASTEQVSIPASQTLGDGDELAILVEKDFACLTPREGEDESDMFPNPLQGQENC